VLVVVIPAAFLTSPGTGWHGWFGLAMLGMLYGFGVLFAQFCKKRFGGLTGDTLGALGEASEVIYLIAVATWLGLSF
jgi:cobalamin synthase